MDDDSLNDVLTCSACGQPVQPDPRFIGLRIECPHCGAVVTVPSPKDMPAGEPAPLDVKVVFPSPPRERKLPVKDSRKRKKRWVWIAAILALLLLLLLLLLNHGSGGGAGGGSGHGVGEGSGPATGTEKEGQVPYNAGKNEAGSGEAPKAVAEAATNPDDTTVLYERTSDSGGVVGRSGTAGGGGTSFFGLSATGGSFVYVVDCSGSMARQKMNIAKESLLFSIAQLDEDQKFFVFFYNHASHPMPGGKMVAATPENKTRAKEWVATIRAANGTNPLNALMAAVNMKPEVIFFMSDGMFSMDVAYRIRTIQGGNPIPIHTIGFVSRDGEAVLKQLAADSGGIYSFVPLNAATP